MEDPMVSIDRLKLKAAIREKFGTLKQLAIHMEVNRDRYGPGFSLRNLEKICSEGEIRRSLLATLAEVLDKSFDNFLLAAEVPWRLPVKEWDQRWRPPASLLHADFEIVPFHFRENEMLELKRWCNSRDGNHVTLRLFTGAGGMGKTRLALELCHRMQKEAWRAGFLDYYSFREDERRWEELLSEPVPLLLVFDYVEHHLSELTWLLPTLMSRTAPRTQVRLLMLARSAGDWWRILKSKKDVGDLLKGHATYTHALAPLAVKYDDRASSFRAAGKAFAEKLGKTRPDAISEKLNKPYFDQVLLLHMSALAAVEGQDINSKDAILAYLLDRERRFWSEHLRDRELSETLLPGIGQFMAIVTATKGVRSREQGLGLLRGLKLFEGQPANVLNAMNEIMAGCYPGGNWIEPLQPDLIGDYLMKTEFSNEELRKQVLRMVRESDKRSQGDGTN